MRGPVTGATRLRGLPDHERVLARHAEALPQPDQLCGPWSAHVALHAVVAAPPSVVDLALASGSRIFPSDVAEWRPPGTVLDTTGWGVLPHVATPAGSGTDARGVATGVEALTEAVVVPVRDVPVTGLGTLLRALVDGPAVGVVANVRTGAVDPDAPFDVGHFVVVWGVDDAGSVALADSYAELADPGRPPGCRVVRLEALHAGLTEPPGRGLLLLVAASDADDVRRLVAEAGADSTLWST